MNWRLKAGYLKAAAGCLLLCLLTASFLFLGSCTKKLPDTVTIEQPFEQWLEQSHTPPDPLQSYGFKESGEWTGWNKFWLASAIGGQAFDAAATVDGLNRGCSEGNPLYGSNPSAGVIVVVKAAVIGFTYWTTEYLLADSQKQQDYRNYLYGALTIFGAGAGLYNTTLDCN